MNGLRDRLNQARQWIEENRLDALVAFSDGQNSFLESNAVYALTNFRAIGESAAIVSREGEVILIVTPSWDGERARAVSLANDVVASDDLIAALSERVEARTLSARGKLAVSNLQKQRRAIAAKFVEAIGYSPVDAGPLVSHLARIRSAEELASTRRAVSIAELGYERLKSSVRPGMREYELAAEIYCYMKELGAEDNFLLMSASQHNLAVRAAGERTLEAGDVILAEITPCFAGQFAQICRTVTIGPASDLIREKYALLQRAMLRGMETATPGTRASEATEAINECFREAGYAAYCRAPFMRVRGHGLGITSNQPGDLGVDNETLFEEGMTFVMHPNQYLPETGYLMCGETVVISHNGAVSLSERDSVLDAIAL